jgi:RHS repeat-associated protein
VATGVNGAETTAITTERYDRQGRLYQVIEPAGAGGANVTTTYGYDEAGRLASVSMGGTQSRSFSYDGRGLLTTECHPEKGAAGNGCVTYGRYNPWGQPGRTTDGPNDLRLVYDRAGRPTEIEEFAGQQRTLKAWTYGTGTGAADRSRGKVQTAERYNYVVLGTIPYTDLVRETYTYGGRSGRVSTRLTENFINPLPGGAPSDSFTQSFVWNDLGDPASLGYPYRLGLPVGRTVTFGYTNGILTSVPGYASSITYHPNGMLNQVAHSNTVTDIWGPDPNKMPRPASIQAWYALGSLSPTLRFTSGAYGYDGSGNVETLGSAYFVYDKVSRLIDSRLYTGAGGGGTQVQQSYGFDAFGNIQSITTNGVTRNTPTSASTNRLTSGTYDGAGNLTGYTAALYEYGPFNDLWHYKNGAEEAIYLYTADDERLWQYNYDLRHQWTLRDLDGKVLREYVYDNPTNSWTVERDYIYRDGILLAAETPQGIRHFSVDHLGTPRLVTNAFGNQVAYHLYYPFGEEATAFNQDAERMKFTGHERDLNSLAGTGDDLDYMHARFCSPVTGRFLSFDPGGQGPRVPQSWNRYAYVLNNPLKWVDPYGLEPCGEGGRFDCQGSFDETITTKAYDLTAFYRFLFDRALDRSGRRLADDLVSYIRDSYEYRSEYNAANDYTTAAFIDLVGLELILPEDGADLGISVAMTVIPPLRGGRLGTKTARELIPASLRRLKSYHEELADHAYDEIVRLSKGRGPTANAARQMKKLIEQADRLLEKGAGKPR